MIQLKAANLAITKLMTGITAADTSFTVEDATLFPDAPFMVTIDAEIMQVGAIDKLTHTFSNVLRGQEGTAAAPHEVGASVDNRWTAGTFNELVTSINEVFTSVSNGKDALASAITDMGQSATGSDTFPTLAGKVRDISKDADAATGDVINGKTFYQGGGKKTGSMQDNGLVTITPGPLDQDLKGHYADGSKVAAVTFDPSKVVADTTIAGTTGTMPNRGSVIITPGTSSKAIAQGYHSGSGYVKGDANLKAANIKKGVSIFGIAGSFASPIKSIQQGTVIGGSDPERRITINPVNVNSTIVLAEDGGYTGYNEDHESDGIWLEDSNTLVVHNDYSKFTIGWKVIEFYPELVKSLQKGTASAGENIPISPVNVSKSLAFAWGVYLYHTSSKLSHRGVVALLYSSYIKLVGGVSSCTWQVIEFY